MEWLRMNRPELADWKGVLAIVYREVERQASMMAFNDVFWTLSLVVGALVPTVLIFRAATGQKMDENP
jgi:hypothetical protein